MMITIHAFLNKELELQNVYMLKCARVSISNQNRQEINNSDWLPWGGGGFVVSYWSVVSYWGVCRQLKGWCL